MSKGTPGVRYAEIERETNETRVRVVLDLDGGSKLDIQTGIPFFDHMLELMGFHGGINLGIKAEGDLEVDDHHLVEDVGIVLGRALEEAIRATDAISRYSSNHTPMDESLVLVAVDISGRPHLSFNVDFRRDSLGNLSTENVNEFFRALTSNGRFTLHIHALQSENDHHLCEAIFKGVGRALQDATQVLDRKGSSSTKGKRD